jgi:hypothetical protein
MNNLTSKQKAFIDRMRESEELSRWGFELLLKRRDFERFFDTLQEAGLFAPERNPEPVPAEKKGYVRIPVWSALQYLLAVAKLSGESNDMTLAGKVMDVVRSVSNWKDSEGRSRDNIHTAHKFATILGLVPTEAVSFDDLKLIPVWLNNKFERMLVGYALDDGAFTRFLGSPFRQDWLKAVEVLKYCTAVEWEDESGGGLGGQNPRMSVDDYWIKKLVNSHSRELGKKVGGKASEVFRQRLREIFGVGTRCKYSQAYRPAVEDDAQNHVWRSVENCAIEGLRDVLLSWSEHDSGQAKLFVEDMLGDDLEIVRRIAIYVVTEQWENLRNLLPLILKPDFFNPSHLHELYMLLSRRFSEFDADEKEQTLVCIKNIPISSKVSDPEHVRNKSQQRWLSALAGKGYPPADEFLASLESDPTLGRRSQHPAFDAYMESWSGPGASPYSSAELIALAKSRDLIDKLNSFEELDSFRGPTTDGLAMTLESTIKGSPETFLRILPDFAKAKRSFQYSLLFGLKQAWDAPNAKQEADWEQGWPDIVSFLEQLTRNEEFWKDMQAPRDSGVVSVAADLLHAGTSNDERAYSSELLPRTRVLVATLLSNAPRAGEMSNDPMTQALNTPKGRAVEALFSQSLRECRIADRKKGSHSDEWIAIQPMFDSEASKTDSPNYEFCALSGTYIAQIEYMSHDWLAVNVNRIFNSDFPPNAICAIDGLGYASFRPSIYKLLVEQEIIDRALGFDLKGRGGRGKLLEWMAVAYLYGEETLDSARFQAIFGKGTTEDLEAIVRLFWMFRGRELTAEQRNRILQFWSRSIEWTRQCREIPTELLEALALMASFLETADGEQRSLLESVAPYVLSSHNTYEFTADLLRLAKTSPDGVSSVFGIMIEKRIPDFDYEDRLKNLIRALAQNGKKGDALRYADRLTTLPGMQELFDELRQSKPLTARENEVGNAL